MLPSKNVTFLRYKFFSYRQSEGQCFDNFVTELKKLSKECEFSALQNSLIRDMRIGITDSYLRERLLREPDLTLDSALKLGHAYEETKNTRLNFDGTLHKILKSTKFINFENLTDPGNEIQILKSS